jgi:serine/threonine protein kinase
MILQLLKHSTILNINEVVYEKAGKYKPPIIYLCLDLMECDLDSILYNNTIFKLEMYHIQALIRTLLEGMVYLHRQNICHRDIKPNNLLVNREGELKIADFGLAKKMTQLSTTRVVTMLYRAPELILGMKNYSTKIDIWSVGCVAA